jgi:prepilin-type N-terminal cleavage/methylation domain-containing protein
MHSHRARTTTLLPRTAFTVVELLIVVAIIGVMAALALPKARLERAQVDVAARSVSSALRLAQRETVSRRHPVIVVFDTTHHLLRAIWDTNNNLQLDPQEKSRAFPLPTRVVLGRGAGVPGYGAESAAVRSLPAFSDAPAIVVQDDRRAARTFKVYLTTTKARAGVGDNETRAVVFDSATADLTTYRWNASRWSADKVSTP